MEVHTPSVEVLPLSIGRHPVHLVAYGSVQAEKVLTLLSPIKGKILSTYELCPGKEIPPNTLIFSIEKTKIDLAIRSSYLQIDELDLMEKKLHEKKEILHLRLSNNKELYEIGKQSLEKHRMNLEIEKKLFEKAYELFSKDNISNTEFLRNKTAMQRAELEFLQARSLLEKIQDNTYQLHLEISNTEQTLEQIDNKRRILRIHLEDLYDDLKKSDLRIDFPAQVLEVFVEKDQEVNAGTPLASIRSIDFSEIIVNIPDHYFKWLYAGNFLNSTESDALKLKVDLVNRNFPKTFQGAYVKSLGGSVNIPSRSLPVIIGRMNPKDRNGKIIPTEELKPGMYCAVTMELCQIENAFLIPHRSIQSDRCLYHVVLGEDLSHMKLAAIENFEILHENDEGLIIRLTENVQHILLVTQNVKKSKIGSKINIKNLNVFQSAYKKGEKEQPIDAQYLKYLQTEEQEEKKPLVQTNLLKNL